MDEIKWSKNETISTNLTNIIYNTTDSITNGEQEYLQEDLPTNDCFNKDNRSVCLNEPNQFLNDHCKIINDNHGKLNIDGLDRQAQIQQIVENTISEESRLRIHQILELVSALTSPEKLLLYLRLPTDTQPISDPLRQPLNPLGSRSEISQTINWIRTHLEEDSQVAMQKQDVYEEYTAYCLENEMKALSTADFGKVMKQVYPKVRPRRLGTRGNSKYCYAGLRKRVKLEAPILPDLLDFPKSTEFPCSQADLMEAASRLVREWAENLLGVQFPTLDSLACHLIEIGSVDTRSVAALTIINAFGRNSDKAVKLKTSSSSPTAGKHRETQLQLQRKLHQREVIREHKRKMQLQSSKCDTNNITSTKRAKKIKIEETTPNTSPTINDESDLLIDSNHHQHATTNGSNYDNTITHNNTVSTVVTNNNTTIVASTPASTNSSPQTIAQGNINNNNNNNNLTNISGTLRLLPVCDTKKIMASTSSTTTTLQLVTLPDFSSFQNNNVNNNNNYNTDENTCDTKSLTTSKQQNTSNKTTVNLSKKPQETITVKAFANKSISRSNSYEHQQNEAQKLEQKPIPPTPPTLPPPHQDKQQKQQRLRVPRLPNTKLKPVIQSKTTKYKNDVRSHDNIVKQPLLQQNPPVPPLLGYYNQIPSAADDKLKLEQIEMKNKLKLIPRERVCSIGNIDKDALDDYLYSGNNSQEPEEEIMQYFQNDSSSVEDFTANKVENNLLNTPIEEHVDEKTDKISQLRLLLEKNLKSTKSPPEDCKSDEIQSTSSSQNNFMYQNSIDPQKSLILSSLLTSNTPGLNTKRRVSFDTYTTATSSVPPSPNTRRQHFNFTPISPGPNSPGGKQSKNSSTNASPFVSPRNTPVPIKYTRNRSTCTKKLSKDDVKLSIDIGKTSGQFVIPNNLPMSAPPSPMLPYRHKQPHHHQQHYLQTLLDADVTSSSPSYLPNDSINEYIERKLHDKTKLAKLKIENPSIDTTSSSDNSPKLSNLTPSNDSTLLVVHSADPLSQEVSQFFPDEQSQPIFNNVDMFRSQSVPLHHQQIKTSDSMIFYNQQQNPGVNYNFMPSNVTSTSSSVGQTPVPNEFNDFTGLGDTTTILNNENLDKIFNILQNDTSSNNMFNELDTSSSQVSSDLVQSSSFMSTPASETPGGNHNNGLLRSQSIDLSGVMMINQNVRYPNNFAPSRSVPSTPLPYVKEQHTASTLLDYGSLSKSHPSTPLINDTGFNYKHTQIGDYLLNGQPIGNNKLNELTSYLSTTSSEVRGAEPFVKSKEAILSDDTPYVDDSFTFSDSVLLVDANDTFNFTTRVGDDTSNVVDNDLMQLSGGGGADGLQTVTPSDTSDNFVTSTNTEQHFLKVDNNKCSAVIDNKFVAGSTKLK
ncbi:dual specificity protein kinase splA [Chrysoperla carnea]|uniref:dual specificity protein kinase splA n=1 Tax=Chrysoperla carnea TaxID=189513 RepID=UPI001D086AD0|nr:dual specificity protein kinase splA [Chrysoperla carnea]